MGKHIELESLSFESGNSRLCLDKIDNTPHYSITWRGSKKTKDGFILRPAYFTFSEIGQLFRKAIKNHKIPEDEFNNFVKSIFDL